MTNESLLALLNECDVAAGKVLIPDKAYHCFQMFQEPDSSCITQSSVYEVIVLIHCRSKAGIILRYGNFDVHWIIKEEYRGKHILSRFLRTGWLNLIWPDNIEVTISDAVDSREEYLQKCYLAELAGLQIRDKDRLDKFILGK